MKKKYGFGEFREIVDTLRSENGCPWDRAQTHESLRPCMIEEAYEAVNAVNRKDTENLCEELGDVLLQVFLHSRIAQEEGDFSLDDVIDGISKKMIRRHPHVFGEQDGRPVPSWEEIKRQEHAGEEAKGPFDGIPEEFPALIRGQKILKKAAGECPSLGEEKFSIKRLEQLLEELKDGQENEDPEAEKRIVTSMVLHCINILRMRGIHAEQAVNDRLDEIAKSGRIPAKNLDKYL